MDESAGTDKKFSQALLEIADAVDARGLALSELLEKIGVRGLLMFSMVLTVPFLLPVSIPGTSAPFGFIIALIAVGIILDRPPWLPQRLMSKRISKEHSLALLTQGAGLFAKIEKLIHPRLALLTHRATMGRVNGAVLALSAVLLMAPLPLPLTNTLPAYGVLFLAAGSLERDGYAVLAGYLMVALTILYFTAILLFGLTGLRALATATP
ncbi:MAG: exopolysaccharide biosynthesis protein [Candidatus Omnitrophica bacterium]|nr:exopolysaccharide biosynthesis protein [Candidatus Omnitrophota bacterium]